MVWAWSGVAALLQHAVSRFHDCLSYRPSDGSRRVESEEDAQLSPQQKAHPAVHFLSGAQIDLYLDLMRGTQTQVADQWQH